MTSLTPRLLIPALLLAGLTGCAAGRGPADISVFAASSLTDAFTEIGAAYQEAHPGSTVTFNFASSSDLATQINEGISADVFAAASEVQMQAVIEAGSVEEYAVFATNVLVIAVPADNPAGVESLTDLANPGLKLVMAGPDVPIRRYTDQVIAAFAAATDAPAGYTEAVYANVVSEEDNVRQVASKVALGEADAGIIYATDATADVRVIEIQADYNMVAYYPIAVLSNTASPDASRAFVDFVLSDEGQSILAAWGFGRPPKE